MHINDLILRASEAYPDDFIARICWNLEKGKPRLKRCGDTLAQFIAIELSDTFDSKADDVEQLTEAIRVLNLARRDVEGVFKALDTERQRLIMERYKKILKESMA